MIRSTARRLAAPLRPAALLAAAGFSAAALAHPGHGTAPEAGLFTQLWHLLLDHHLLVAGLAAAGVLLALRRAGRGRR